MNQHKHDHKDTRRHPKPKQGLHTDWRLWGIVALMLGAMLIYVLSDDEAIQPGDPNPVPAVPASP